ADGHQWTSEHVPRPGSGAAIGPVARRAVEIGLGVHPARRSHRALIPTLEPSEQAIDLEQGQERDQPARQEPQEEKSKHAATMAARTQPGGHRSTLPACRSLTTPAWPSATYATFPR